MDGRVVHPGVVPVRLGQQEVLLPRPQQGLPGEALTIGQALRQRLATRLWQQQQADDAQQGAAGEEDVVQEVALLVVELHDRGGEHAEAGAGQHQAQASTPKRTRPDGWTMVGHCTHRYTTKREAKAGHQLKRAMADSGHQVAQVAKFICTNELVLTSSYL